MKLPVLICCLLPCACALHTAPRMDPAQMQIQRQRLREMFASDLAAPPPPLVRYVRPSARWMPPPSPRRQSPQNPQQPQNPKQPQEPIGRRPGERAIDDVTPAVAAPRDTGYRDAMGFRSEPVADAAPQRTAVVSAGLGTVAVHSPGTQLDDQVSVQHLEVAVEPPPGEPAGLGLRVSAMLSDSGMFAGETLYNGTGQRPADATLSEFGLFPHLRWQPWQAQRRGDLGLTMQLGLQLDWLRLDHPHASVTRNWTTVGPRIELEPGLCLDWDADSNVTLFGRFAVDGGVAWLQESWANGTDMASTTRWGGEVGAGLRLQWRDSFGEVGYSYRRIQLGDADTDLYAGLHRLDVGDQGLRLQFGTRF